MGTYDSSKGAKATASVSHTFPVFGLATAVLFVLKVADIGGASWGLDISWWLVFAPILAGIGITLAVLLFLGLIIGVVVLVTFVVDEAKSRKRRNRLEEKYGRNTPGAKPGRYKP